MQHLLEVNNLSMYFGGVRAVDDLSFYVEEHEFIGIIGPNGSGKTTVFNAVTGVYTPTAGHVIFDGKDITGKPLYDMVRFGIARTFQNLRSFRGMTAMQNIMMGDNINVKTNFFDAVLHTSKWRRYEKRTTEKAMVLMEMLGLSDYANEYVGSMPYGLQKRVELARAIITEPKLIMLDEPAAGLNTKEADGMLQVVCKVKEEKNLTVIMIEHNMKVMMATAQRIIAMDSGREIAMGTPDEIQNNQKVINAYLGEEDM